MRGVVWGATRVAGVLSGALLMVALSGCAVGAAGASDTPSADGSAAGEALATEEESKLADLSPEDRAKFVGEEAAAIGVQQAVASPPAASGSPAPGPQASAAIGALAAGSRALGFGPKPKEKDPEKAALIAATVLVALVCIVAIGLSFAMSAV